MSEKALCFAPRPRCHPESRHPASTTSLARLYGDDHRADGEDLFARIASDLEQQGFSIQPAALPDALAQELFLHQQQMRAEQFREAGIGRGDEHQHNAFVRTDAICWITGESEAGQNWLGWSGRLQGYLNRRLFLGLFSFESHFAHYAPGDYYKRHVDAFHGQANRILSVVTYLNPGWGHDEGGELVIYRDEQDLSGIRVVPLMGTVVVFLSEEFPHEVLPASRDRYSVAGWFRVNTTQCIHLGPPR